MPYNAYLKPRQEVISDKDTIDGIIDIANVFEIKKKILENNPQKFFELTYLTDDIKKVISKLNNRFKSNTDCPGLFLFEGFKGSGKSHLLLLIYHLFKNRKEGQKWLSENNIKCDIPDNVSIIINKFTDNPTDSIWNLISEKITNSKFHETNTHPGLDDFVKLIGDKKIILIFDELEQGIKVIRNDASKQAQNIAFLQMLTEYANRTNNITLFTSIYNEQYEPGSTLKRIQNRVSIQFNQSKEKNKVILHRLFENYINFDINSVSVVIENYIEIYKKYSSIQFDWDKEKQKMFKTYPFSPDLMDIIINRIPPTGGFQNVRGALAFLANLVKLTYLKKDLITPADALITDETTMTMLGDLDSNGLIAKAENNFEELKDKPLSIQLSSAVLLYSLTGQPGKIGAARDELLLSIMTPEININDFDQIVNIFQKYASYFHYKESRYFFDIQENADAKVEYQSLKYDKSIAVLILYNIYKNDIFNEKNCLIYDNLETTKEILDKLDKNKLRYVLTGRRLVQEERHKIYFGQSNQNMILILEPKDDRFNLIVNPDLIKWAKLIQAADDLKLYTNDNSRKIEYERIKCEYKKRIIDTIIKAGLSLVIWIKYLENISEDEIEFETISGSCSRDVLDTIRQEIYPANVFEHHLQNRLNDIIGKYIRNIDNEYKIALGFPVKTAEEVQNALRVLCKKKIVGIEHIRGRWCGKDPDLNESELLDAKIIDSFEEVTVTRSEGQQLPSKPVGSTSPASPTQPKPQTSKIKRSEIKVPPQENINKLRQEFAVKTNDFENFYVVSITYKIFLDKYFGDISVLTTALRGSLTGSASIITEISISKQGRFTKSEIEKQIESLPNINLADYSIDSVLEIEC